MSKIWLGTRSGRRLDRSIAKAVLENGEHPVATARNVERPAVLLNGREELPTHHILGSDALFGVENGCCAAAASRATVERRPAVMTWLALVTGIAICAIATLL